MDKSIEKEGYIDRKGNAYPENCRLFQSSDKRLKKEEVRVY